MYDYKSRVNDIITDLLQREGRGRPHMFEPRGVSKAFSGLFLVFLFLFRTFLASPVCDYITIIYVYVRVQFATAFKTQMTLNSFY